MFFFSVSCLFIDNIDFLLLPLIPSDIALMFTRTKPNFASGRWDLRPATSFTNHVNQWSDTRSRSRVLNNNCIHTVVAVNNVSFLLSMIVTTTLVFTRIL